MKIDFSTVLLGLDGKPLKAPDGEKVKDLTLAGASVEALMATTTESAKDPGDLKLRCYTLAQKVNGAGEVEVEPGDADFIKTKIAAVYGPAVVGPAFTLLNG